MPDLVFWTYDLGDRSQILVVKTILECHAKLGSESVLEACQGVREAKILSQMAERKMVKWC